MNLRHQHRGRWMLLHYCELPTASSVHVPEARKRVAGGKPKRVATGHDVSNIFRPGGAAERAGGVRFLRHHRDRQQGDFAVQSRKETGAHLKLACYTCSFHESENRGRVARRCPHDHRVPFVPHVGHSHCLGYRPPGTSSPESSCQSPLGGYAFNMR